GGLDGGSFRGAMKFSHAVGHQAVAGLSSLEREFPWLGRGGFKFVQSLVPQAATFTGILAARKTQEALGLQTPGSKDSLIADAFANLVQFHVAGRWSEGLLGPRYQAWLQGLELRAQPAKPPVAEQRGPKLAMASSFPGVEIRPESRPGLLMAEGTDGKKEPGWLERLKSFVPRAVRLAYVDHALGPRSSKILREYQLAELGRHAQA